MERERFSFPRYVRQEEVDEERLRFEAHISRRTFLKATTALGITTVAAACGAPTATGGPAASAAPATAAAAATTSAAPAASAAADPYANETLKRLFPGGKAAGEGITFSDGMMLAMTGQGAFFGKVMSRGAKLAAKQIKASGGPDFQISIADHQSGLVPPAVTGVRKLITQDRILTLQTSYGAPSEAIIPLIQENKILTFNGGGSSPGQLFKDYLWMNRMLFGYDPTDGALAWLAKTKPDVKNLAVLGTNENAVEAWRDKVPKIWPVLSNGGKIVAKEIHEVGLTDFSSIVARVKASGADAVFTVSFGEDLGYTVKQFREANYKGPIVGIEFTNEACKIAGPLYDSFVFATDYFDPKSKNPFTAQFVKAHQAEYGEEAEYYGSNYYEQVFVISELIRRVIKKGGDPKNTEQLQNALKEDPTFLSVYGGDESKVGTASFDLKDHTISKPMGVFSLKGCGPERLASIKRIGPNDDPRSALVG